MRLLHHSQVDDSLVATEYVGSRAIPPVYAILSHTWGRPQDEVSYQDMELDTGREKTGYNKIALCQRWTAEYGLKYFWLDTCCIDKRNHAELSEAIISMYEWYRRSGICFVYLSDVRKASWQADMKQSRWFTRGWTLQELIAPLRVEFFDRDGVRLGDKSSLEDIIHEITMIPRELLRGGPLQIYSTDERITWSEHRSTDRAEDAAYSLFGIFDVSMPVLYGEGKQRAFKRLWEHLQISQHVLQTRPSEPKITSNDPEAEDELEQRQLMAEMEMLPRSHRRLIRAESSVNGLGYDFVSGHITVSIPMFDWQQFLSIGPWTQCPYNSSAFRLAHRLEMLPKQKNESATRYTTMTLQHGTSDSNYKAQCSLLGLWIGISLWFRGFRLHQDTFEITVQFGTFTFKKEQMMPIVRYISHESENETHKPVTRHREIGLPTAKSSLDFQRALLHSLSKIKILDLYPRRYQMRLSNYSSLIPVLGKVLPPTECKDFRFFADAAYTNAFKVLGGVCIQELRILCQDVDGAPFSIRDKYAGLIDDVLKLELFWKTGANLFEVWEITEPQINDTTLRTHLQSRWNFVSSLQANTRRAQRWSHVYDSQPYEMPSTWAISNQKNKDLWSEHATLIERVALVAVDCASAASIVSDSPPSWLEFLSKSEQYIWIG